MKKKALSLLLVLCMVFALFPFGAMAWDPADENYVDSGDYHQDSGVTWVILEEDGENVLYIEGSGAMDGKEATDQYDYDREYRPRWDDAKDPWDSYSSTITKIVIGDGITSLGHNTFTGLRQVKEVVVGDGVTTIATHQDQKGEYGNTISAAFYQLSNMTKITLGAKVATVSPDMFKYCNDLKTIEISAQNPNMQLKDGIILDRTGTKVLMVPEGVLEHDYSDPTYPTLTIPEGVTELTDVSINSYYMGKLVLPSTLTKLDKSVFSSLGNLSEIEVAEGNNAFFTKDGILYSKDPVAIVLVPSKLSGEIELADGLTALPEDTFEYNSTITKITLPASLTDVTSKAITTMTGLQEVAVKEGNEKLSVENGLLIKTDGADKEVLFLNANYAGTVTIPEGVKELRADVFGNNSSKRPLVTGLELPASLENIINGGSVWSPQTPFSLLTGLETVKVAEGSQNYTAESNVLYNADKTEIVGVPMQLSGDIVIPEGVTSVGNQFADHPKITSVTFPASLASIGSNAFSGCTALEKFDVSADSESFAAQDGILYDKDMTKFVAVPTAISGDIVIPDTVTSAVNGYYSAFRNWSNVTSITLPEALSELETNTFQNCENLTYMVLPEALTELPYGAFEGCSNLEKVYIPAGVTTVGSGWSARYYPAFKGCDKLTDIYFGGTEDEWNAITFGNDEDKALVGGDTVTVHFNHEHEGTVDVKVDATCEADGYSGQDCVCGYHVKQAEVVPALGHKWDEGKVTKEATCTEAGEMTFTCQNDETHTKVEEIPAKGHDLKKTEAVAAACEKAGTEAYWKCETCGKLFSDAEGKTEIEAPVAIAALGHKWDEGKVTKEATCTEAGEMTFTCQNDKTHTKVEEIPAKGHDLKKTEAVAATCETDGSIEYWTCSECGKLFSDAEGKTVITKADTVVKAKGHDLKKVDAVAATCEEAGTEAYWKCEICGKLFGDAEGTTEIEAPVAIAALGHKWDEGKVTKEATCTEAGEMTFTCQNDKTHTKVEEIPAKGHDLKKVDAVAATCEEDGNIEYWTCSVCSKLFSDAEGKTEITKDSTVLKAIGHDWDEGKVTKEPTYTAEGEKTFTCKNDPKHTRTEPVAKLDKCDGGENCPSKAFTDVDRGAKSWSHEAIDWAVVNKVTNGMDATHFMPNSACTRAQAVTFLWRAMGEPEPTGKTNPFTDVKEGAYYYKAVLWAVEKEITNGTAADKFSPDATCTRGQIVTFLWRAEGKPAAKAASTFTDVAASEYYAPAVAWAVENGITNGTTPTTFAPNDSCTRAHIVTFLHRDIVK